MKKSFFILPSIVIVYMKKRMMQNRFFSFTMAFILLFFVSTSIWIISYRWSNPSMTMFMRRDLYKKRQIDSHTALRKELVSLHDIPNQAVLATLVAEDPFFLLHFGFEYKTMFKLLKCYLCTNKERYKGASTITQQLAKNMFLYPDQTLCRKVIEAYFALLLGGFFDKK